MGVAADPVLTLRSTDAGLSVLFFDLETQKLIREVGGRSRIDRLGMSVGVTYSPGSGRYTDYFEDDVDALIAELRAADVVVGFNLLRFDYRVLQAYTDDSLMDIPTLDIMLELERHLGFRVGLEALAKETLGEGKSADGLQAVRWYRQGKLDKIASYCRKDVDVTRRLFEAGKERGYVSFRDRAGRRVDVPASWSPLSSPDRRQAT